MDNVNGVAGFTRVFYHIAGRSSASGPAIAPTRLADAVDPVRNRPAFRTVPMVERRDLRGLLLKCLQFLRYTIAEEAIEEHDHMWVPWSDATTLAFPWNVFRRHASLGWR